MDWNARDPSSTHCSTDEHEFDLYTIPACASWFSWDDIHETEKDSLGEFFDGNSITRSPRIYKEYRDFIVNKYREDPNRRLTFTEVRKSLVGDINLLHKVFRFLEKWGLINFSTARDLSPPVETPEVAQNHVVKEEAVPNGVRVVVLPYGLKTAANGLRVRDDTGYKPPTLASYSDVYENPSSQKGSGCSNCQEPFDLEFYESQKEKLLICKKCFESSDYGDSKSAEDFKLMDCGKISEKSGNGWTEAENLLLLESILKHGNAWELVAQNIKSKSKFECISRIVEMPFGDLVFNSLEQNTLGKESDDTGSGTQEQINRAPSREGMKTEANIDRNDVEIKKDERGEESENAPQKRKFSALISDTAASSLTKQLRRISEMSAPKIKAAADRAALRAVSEEKPCARMFLFDSVDDGDDSEIQPEIKGLPPMLRIRSAVASVLGSAAAHSKLLADKEVREMESLVSNMIEFQLKKVQAKTQKLEALKAVMAVEYGRIQELKPTLTDERISVLQKIFSSRPSQSGSQRYAL